MPRSKYGAEAASSQASTGDSPARTPTHILIPYRPSRRSDRAIRAAAELARESGAQLTVLAPVVSQEKGTRCCGIQGERWVQMLREAADDDLERARKALDGGSRAAFATAEGEAFHEVVKQFAREYGCDLTVMAPSVLGALARRANPGLRGQSRQHGSSSP